VRPLLPDGAVTGVYSDAGVCQIWLAIHITCCVAGGRSSTWTPNWTSRHFSGGPLRCPGDRGRSGRQRGAHPRPGRG